MAAPVYAPVVAQALIRIDQAANTTPNGVAGVSRDDILLAEQIRQALAATGVRAAEGDVVAQRDIKPGNYLDFGGIVFQVVRSDATGIRVRTPYGVAMLPAGPVPATVRTKKPDKVLRPRSLLDVRARRT